jgi:hypothetical protein
MIRSAAIVKTKNPLSWKEIRLQKLKHKKAQALERKLTKVCYPSPIRAVVQQVEIVEVGEPTRDEMLEQAAKIGLKVDKRWSDETLLNRINQAMEAASWDTASASS